MCLIPSEGVNRRHGSAVLYTRLFDSTLTGGTFYNSEELPTGNGHMLRVPVSRRKPAYPVYHLPAGCATMDPRAETSTPSDPYSFLNGSVVPSPCDSTGRRGSIYATMSYRAGGGILLSSYEVYLSPSTTRMRLRPARSFRRGPS